MADYQVDCRKFVEQGCLSFAVASLSSRDVHVRQAGYHVLSRYMMHLEGARFKERKQVGDVCQTLNVSKPADRQKDRQTDRQTDRHMGRQLGRQSARQTNKSSEFLGRNKKEQFSMLKIGRPWTTWYYLLFGYISIPLFICYTVKRCVYNVCMTMSTDFVD